MATKAAKSSNKGTDPLASNTINAEDVQPRKVFKRTKLLTLPLFKLKEETPMYVKITTPMFLGKKIDDQKEAATLCNVINLETGAPGQIIVNAVLRSTLQETYEGDSYVGRCFELIKHAKIGDKRYNTFTLAEVGEE